MVDDKNNSNNCTSDTSGGESEKKCFTATCIHTGSDFCSTHQQEQQSQPEPQQNRPKKKQQAPKTRRMVLSSYPRRCKIHEPSLEELRSMSFTDYVSRVVLRSVRVYEDDEENDELLKNRPFEAEPDEWTEGIAKVKLPAGFWQQRGIATDNGDNGDNAYTTGRGPAWEAGTALGDYSIGTPIAQFVRGVAGVYEYTFTDKPGMTLSEFRQKADEYRVQQVGRAVDDDEEQPYDDDDSRISALERTFWRRLGPTMPPAWYGADHEGSLFGTDPASGWSLADLDSCLRVLGSSSSVPGVTSPYLYLGMWASVFCAHAEDVNLCSINYLHAGAPKLWYAVAPGPDAARLESLCAFHYAAQAGDCKEFLRHKRCLLSPRILRQAGIRYTTAVQYPGEAVIAFPGGYHFGFNTGFNVAEATNFAVPEWIPHGMRAGVCLCRPDSVRIDMAKLNRLLQRYQAAKRKEPSLTWKEWGLRRERRRVKEEDDNAKEDASLLRINTIPAEQLSAASSAVVASTGTSSFPAAPGAASTDPVDFFAAAAAAAAASVFGDGAAAAASLFGGDASVVAGEAPAFAASAGDAPASAGDAPASAGDAPASAGDAPACAGDAPASAGDAPASATVAAAASTTTPPISAKKRPSPAKKTPRPGKKNEFWVEVVSPQSLKKQNNNKKKGSKKRSAPPPDVWHLAKPLPRKSLLPGAKVLCIVPAKKKKKSGAVSSTHSAKGNKSHPAGSGGSDDKKYDEDEDRSEDEEEECYAGQVIQVNNDHARVRLDGMLRTDDVWLPITANGGSNGGGGQRLFLDGGRWDDEHEAKGIPPRHYWHWVDSKRRC